MDRVSLRKHGGKTGEELKAEGKQMVIKSKNLLIRNN